MTTTTQDKQQRIQKANELIKTIGTCGRKFFNFPDHHGLARFEVDERGQVWFIDSFTGNRIRLHYRNWERTLKRKFNLGGTLKVLVKHLRHFIVKGELVPSSQFGPWPEWQCGGDVWGYGNDMERVRDCAIELEIIKRRKSTINGKRYEYGRIVVVPYDGESERTVIGIVDESEYDAKKAEIDHCNRLSGVPNHRGQIDSSTTWFIDEIPPPSKGQDNEVNKI
ncbi:MAG: hypothetical protein GY928_34000 [Colwellia sp.]|nr:hypothetical protein [Colwellia sp.]